MPLDAARQRAARQRISHWRSDPAQPVACPACEREGLVIIDRSARPHAEWYALARAACGLDETLHVALGPPVPSLD